MHNPELANLLTQGIKSIAARKRQNIASLQDELAYRCAEAVGRESLTGHAVQRWRQEGHIPRHEYTEVLARACVKEGGMGRPWLRSFLHQARYYDPEQLISELFPGGEDLVSPTRHQVYHNLPQPDYGRFIGRAPELDELRHLLRPDSQCRVITIVGAGGVGKSALALEIAHHYLREYERLPSGERFDAIIRFSARETALTAQRITRTRQRNPPPLRDLHPTISVPREREDIRNARAEEQGARARKALAQQRTLLILDNLESQALPKWLQRGKTGHLIWTLFRRFARILSRKYPDIKSVEDEQLIAFLRQPPAPTKVIITTRHWADVGDRQQLEEMPKDDAKALITERCEKHKAALSEEKREKLYERTKGLPLAIVWSVAQMGYGYGVETVLSRLRQTTDDLARFCFEGSVAPLRGTDAHKLLMALAMFDIDADREALGRVANLSEMARDEGLVTLRRLSLVNKQADRFSLLPLTRIYAQNELDSNKSFYEEVRSRQVSYLLEVAKAILDSPSKREQDRLAKDAADISPIIDTCYDRKEWENVVKFVGRMLTYWEDSGHWQLALHHCDQAERAAHKLGDTRARARILRYAKGWIRFLVGDFAVSKACVEESLRLYQELKLPEHVGANWRLLGKIEMEMKDFGEAERCLKIALSILEPLRDTGHSRRQLGFTYADLGQLAFRKGQLDQAIDWQQRAIKEHDKIGFRRGKLSALDNLVAAQRRTGELKAAREDLKTLSSLADELDYARAKVHCLREDGLLDLAEGDVDKAMSKLRKAKGLYEKLGDLRWVPEIDEAIKTTEIASALL